MAGLALIDGRLLTRTLTDPGYALTLDERGWTSLLTIAHAERLAGSLAWRLHGLDVPEKAAAILAQARASAEQNRVQALWEAEMAKRALEPLGISLLLLKGTAYAACGLDAARGRLIGDLDIMVPRDRLDDVERALIAAGWDWVKPDPYDDAYYRTHMHELPPLIHQGRDRMIDVHHSILPLTARPKPDSAAMIADAVPLGNGVSVLAPADMLIHAIAHLLADGDLEGGLRNLWDIDRLIREFAERDGDFWPTLVSRARRHSLVPHVSRALRLAHHIYETPVDRFLAYLPRRGDIIFVGRLLARNGWGRDTRKILRLAFYIRSHWLRMPPIMLARHLWIKWRRRRS